jgi:protease I
MSNGSAPGALHALRAWGRTISLQESFMAHSPLPSRVVILTADAFEDLEVFYPMFRLQESGAIVDIAAPTMAPIHGEHGYALEPVKTFEQVDPDAYDLLIIPGGFPDGAPLTVRQHPKALAITRSFFAKGKAVASICHGPWTLADAGVVKGRHVTSYWHDGVPEDLKQAGAIYEDASVVVDGNLVTSRWPPDLPDFMREVMAKLHEGRR